MRSQGQTVELARVMIWPCAWGNQVSEKNIFNVQVSQTRCSVKRAEYEPKTTKKELWQISPETSFPLAQYRDQYFTDQSVAYCFLSKTETLFDHVNALKEKILQKKTLIP